MSPTTLADFLLVRIAEDEAMAREAAWGVPWESAGCDVHETTATPHGEIVAADCWTVRVAAHIARQDPAHVLATCAAHRAIVERVTCPDAPDCGDHDCITIHEDRTLLATIYADRPGFDPAWVAS